MKSRLMGYYCLLLAAAVPMDAFADFEGTLSNLVNSIVGRILPIFAMGYVGKNIFGHIQGNPLATQESLRVGLGVVSLIAIRSVWAFLQSQAR